MPIFVVSSPTYSSPCNRLRRRECLREGTGPQWGWIQCKDPIFKATCEHYCSLLSEIHSIDNRMHLTQYLAVDNKRYTYVF